MRKRTKLAQISRPQEPMSSLSVEQLMPLPPPYDRPDSHPSLKELPEGQDAQYESSLDGVSALLLPKLKTKKEEEDLVKKFLAGLEKLLSKENNWTFLQPFMLSLENCAKCQTCSDACPTYIASGKQEIYRPIFRSEVFRRIVNKYLKKQGKIASFLSGSDIELNWTTLARLAELAYRCTSADDVRRPVR